MPTSGSVNYTVSAYDIIKEALQQTGVIPEGVEPTQDQISSSMSTLNMMTKAWQADGLNLFAVQETFLFPITNQSKYTLDASTTDHWTTSFTQTTTSAAAVATDTSITLTDATGVAVGTYIGVKRDDGETLHWTTISDVSSSPTVTLTDALPADVASGNLVFFYNTKANRPMKVLEAYINQPTTGTDYNQIPVDVISRVEWGRLNQQSTSGTINQVYQDPQVGTFYLQVWPTVSSERDYLRVYVQRTLSDFDCVVNTPDYPQEWYLPLAYNLAVLISTKYGVPTEIYNRLRAAAGQFYELARGFDEEAHTSIYFQPGPN